MQQNRHLHPNIIKFQKRDLPMNNSTLSINKMGKMEDTMKSKLDQRIVCGYGVIWGSVNDYQEMFVKGCFAKSISDLGPASNSAYKIKFRDRHGKSCSLFAQLKEDDIGLYFETLPLDDVSWANDLLTQLRSGTINNFSIGFKHIWERVEWDDENDCMVNLEARLFEISAVDIPSDMETYAVRSAEELEFINDDVEEFILTLPKSRQLDGRRIFARCMAPIIEEPPVQRKALDNNKPPVKKAVDYTFLTQNLKLK